MLNRETHLDTHRVKLLLCLMLLAIGQTVLCAQDDDELSDEVMKTIRSDVEKCVPAFKKSLPVGYDMGPAIVEFCVDTFRVEETYREMNATVETSMGTVTATSRTAAAYDKLLNKWFGKLRGKLGPEEKKALVKAQKAWIAFRDAELELTGKLADRNYQSGDGVMAEYPRHRAEYVVVKARTEQLFRYYVECLEKDQSEE